MSSSFPSFDAALLIGVVDFFLDDVIVYEKGRDFKRPSRV